MCLFWCGLYCLIRLLKTIWLLSTIYILSYSSQFLIVCYSVKCIYPEICNHICGLCDFLTRGVGWLKYFLQIVHELSKSSLTRVTATKLRWLLPINYECIKIINITSFNLLKYSPDGNIYISDPWLLLSIGVYEDGYEIRCGAISFRKATMGGRCDQTLRELIYRN